MPELPNDTPGLRNARHDAIMAQERRAREASERVLREAQARTTQPNQRSSPHGDPEPQRHPANLRDTPTTTAQGTRKGRKGRKGRKSRKRRKGRKSRKSRKGKK